PQPTEGKRNACRVSQFPEQYQALLAQRFCPIIIELEESQVHGSLECLHLRRRSNPFAPRQRPFQKVPALTPMTTDIPEPPQRCSQPQSHLAVVPHLSSFERPPQRCSQVVILSL